MMNEAVEASVKVTTKKHCLLKVGGIASSVWVWKRRLGV